MTYLLRVYFWTQVTLMSKKTNSKAHHSLVPVVNKFQRQKKRLPTVTSGHTSIVRHTNSCVVVMVLIAISANPDSNNTV